MSHTESARQAALRLLARRDHSLAELKLKLQQRGFDKITISTVLELLQQNNLLNQPRFIENYIHFRKQKGWGPLCIQQELIARGIAEESIEEKLNIDDNAWLQEATKVLQKKFKHNSPSDFKAWTKQARFLQYRGFTKEQIREVLVPPFEKGRLGGI